MNQRSFETLLYTITSGVVSKIAEENNWPEDLAMKRFTRSKVYAYLEREETKVWQYSIFMLTELFNDERSGNLVLPEV